jgi:hypothetical protein
LSRSTGIIPIVRKHGAEHRLVEKLFLGDETVLSRQVSEQCGDVEVALVVRREDVGPRAVQMLEAVHSARARRTGGEIACRQPRKTPTPRSSTAARECRITAIVPIENSMPRKIQRLRSARARHRSASSRARVSATGPMSARRYARRPSLTRSDASRGASLALVRPRSTRGQPDANLLRLADALRRAGALHKTTRYWTSALTLPYLKAITPKGHDVEFVDELMHDVDLDHECDVVGITAMGPQIARAYDLAREFRARGRRVVLGGTWVTLTAEESLKHADAVVAGEAEDVWPEVLADFSEGTHEGHLPRDGGWRSLAGMPAIDYETLPLLKRDAFRDSALYRMYFHLAGGFLRGVSASLRVLRRADVLSALVSHAPSTT